ncbi:hypothetical protein GQ457_18G022310 [Hibiscus cannabinus]
MARQIVLLALVFIALVGMVSAASKAASSSPAASKGASSSPAPAPGGAGVDLAGAPEAAAGGSSASSPASEGPAGAPSAGKGATLEVSTVAGVGAAAIACYFMF